jgi:hypothetical protein
MEPRFKKGDTAIDQRSGDHVRIASEPMWDEQMESWSYRVSYMTGPNAPSSGRHTSLRGVLDAWLDPMAEMRQFIRENLLMTFGLNRFVTMNALNDVVGGPTDGSKHMRVDHPDAPEVDATAWLVRQPMDEIDEPEGLGDE